MTENVIYIGKKDTMSYVSAVTIQALQKDSLVLRARGTAIKKAVDVSQIVIDRFLKNWKVRNINIGTEELVTSTTETDKEKAKTQTIRVSYIEIEMKKEG